MMNTTAQDDRLLLNVCTTPMLPCAVLPCPTLPLLNTKTQYTAPFLIICFVGGHKDRLKRCDTWTLRDQQRSNTRRSQLPSSPKLGSELPEIHSTYVMKATQ
ncbi:hypothetical protein E2C01_025325 [Portunus trituberculatus]|uniref:Uncharacterized protein n=1 Tax=Portunus trituberculatus TaxID=210409 RepID=A0A5B7EHL9_PORTR|nr:hypothetical protein [Portunus trituberculatus]